MCPQGSTAEALVPAGSYSPAGQQLFCPAGTRTPQPGAVALLDCLTCPISSGCLGDGTCAKGHGGLICSECERANDVHAGYYLLNDLCRPCPDWGEYAWTIGFATALIVAVVVWWWAGKEGDAATASLTITHLQISAVHMAFSTVPTSGHTSRTLIFMHATDRPG